MAVPSQPPPPSPRPPARLGVDVGATLAKLAIARGEERIEHRLVPAHAIERLALEVEAIAPARVGLTGGGALPLARRLCLDTTPVNEFDAWRAGSHALLRREGLATGEPHLLVSLGTGTSVLRVEGERVTRVGGTALGGGTLLGLGAALTGERDFERLAQLARAGDRRRVDLLVSDVYHGETSPLPGAMTAASFAKLASPGREPAAARDLAHALIGLVGENVGLICGALALLTGTRRIVFGGSTLRGNPSLVEILAAVSARLGREAIFPRDAEFAGALGALELASPPASEAGSER
jgi:type II pantothenate kinase